MGTVNPSAIYQMQIVDQQQLKEMQQSSQTISSGNDVKDSTI